MSEINQNITGDNNLQVGTNNGQIIQTKQIKQVTEVLHDPNQHITDAQALEIRNKITELVDMLASTGKNKGSLFKQEYNTFYKEFKISSYKLLPKDKYEEALIWLRKRNAYKGKKVLRQGNKEEWRKEQYTAIYFKAGNLGMSKEDLYLFATEKLALKKPLTSLKELSDTRLEKLYKFIIVKK